MAKQNLIWLKKILTFSQIGETDFRPSASLAYTGIIVQHNNRVEIVRSPCYNVFGTTSIKHV